MSQRAAWLAESVHVRKQPHCDLLALQHCPFSSLKAPRLASETSNGHITIARPATLPPESPETRIRDVQ